MGWASGVDIAVRVIETIQEHVRSRAKRRAIYEEFYLAMADHDWDTEDESLGIDPVWDALMASYGHGVEDEEDEDD